MIAPHPHSIPKAQMPTFRILLADDSVESHLVVQGYLRDTTYHVEVVSDGAHAVAAFQANPFDLVLINEQMPVMDGFTATRLIREWECAHRQVAAPILALTAHSLEEAQEQSRSAGCTGLLLKPLTKQQLIDAIRTYSLAASTPEDVKPTQSRADMTVGIEEEIRRRRPLFLNHRRNDLRKMRDAVDQKDFDSLTSMGHRIKGLAGSYGFPEIGLAGAHLESAARAKDLASVERAITELARLLDRAQQAA